MASKVPVIVWFRNDLRLGDHPALKAAAETGSPILAVFVLDDAAQGTWARGGASRWWLHGSLAALTRDLDDKGCRLVLRQGETVSVLSQVMRETGARMVYCSRAFEPWARDLETRLNAAVRKDGGEVKRFAGTLLHNPDDVLTQTGGPFKVYTPFWRAMSKLDQRRPVGLPDAIDGYRGDVTSDDLEDWGLRPTAPDWARQIRATWQPGEKAAKQRLSQFLDTAIRDYAERRDVPGIAGTSRLSPHLHFGEITPVQIWQAVTLAVESGELGGRGPEVFLKEVAWREFSYHLLYHFPALPTEPFRDAFKAFAWEQDETGVKAWQRGQTGYPIVDAGMRELWATGWMHNRVRMITASFLIKHLMVPWQKGERWFWDCLVDADLASNAASWQWVAGSGADAAPYFRIFNPILQGQKFDPDGAYVRRWVPEIARLPDRYLHAPWEAPAAVLVEAGIKLGRHYPRPIVDHKRARDRALSAYEAMRKS